MQRLVKVKKGDKVAIVSPSFAESIKVFQKQEKILTKTDRKKILTVHSMFGDELVPPETTTIYGAKNIHVPMIEHALSIGSALTVFSKPIIDFLKLTANR